MGISYMKEADISIKGMLIICGVLVWILGQINIFFTFLPETLKESSLVFQPLEELGAYLFEKINTKQNPIDDLAPILQKS